MKKMKKLSMLLSAVMLSSAIVMPAQAEEVYSNDFESVAVQSTKQVWLDDDFTGYADDAALRSAWVTKMGQAQPTIVEENGKKMMKFTRTNTDNDFVENFIRKIETGKVDVKVKFKIKYGTENTVPLVIGMRTNDTGKNLILAYMKNSGCYTNVTGHRDGYQFTDFVTGQSDDRWYELRATIDMDTHKYDVAIIDGDKVSMLTDRDVVSVGTSNVMPNISSVYVQTWSGKTAGAEVYVSEASVTEHDADFMPEEPDQTLIYSDDFESYATDAELQAKWSDKNGKAVPVLATDEKGSKVLKFTNKPQNEDNNFVRHHYGKITTGKVRFKSRFKVNYGENAQPSVLVGVGNNDTSQSMNFVYLVSSAMCVNTTSASGTKYENYVAGNADNVWYEVEAIIDLDKKTFTSTVKDNNGTYTAPEMPFNCVGKKDPMSDIASVFIQTWGGTANTTDIYLDDVSLEYVTEPIELETSNIGLIKADGTEGTFGAEISASTTDITIDFETAMKSKTLNDENIVLKNVTDDKTVAYKGTLNGTVYKMTLSKLLEPNKNYELQINTRVKTLGGGKLEENKTFAFKTDAGECAISLGGLKIGNNVEPTVAEITAATSANVTISVVNSTAQDADLVIIAAYYDGDEMKYVGYTPVELKKADYENKTFDLTIDLPTGKTADNVKIFAWDTITGMVPYGTNLDIK